MRERAPITAADREWRRQRRLAEINAELERLREQFNTVLDSLAMSVEPEAEAEQRVSQG